MPFNQKPQKFNAKINTVTVGTGDKAVTIGGNSTFPFYTFDAPTENRPKIGVEITDLGLDDFAPGIKATMRNAPLWLILLRKQQLWKVEILLYSIWMAEIQTELTSLQKSLSQ